MPSRSVQDSVKCCKTYREEHLNMWEFSGRRGRFFQDNYEPDEMISLGRKQGKIITGVY